MSAGAAHVATPPSDQASEASYSCVLDASALLAFLHEEPGSDVVSAVLEHAAVGAVNWSEVVQKALARGVAINGLREEVQALGVRIVPFDSDDAERAASLWSQTASLGLSLGDRACLALGLRLALPVYTADRSWKRLDIGVGVETIRR